MSSGSAEKAQVRVRLVSGWAGPYERAFLFCPREHEVGSTSATSRTGRKWTSGDLTGGFCGHGGCDWETDHG